MNKDKKQLVALLPILFESGLELKYMNDIERWAPSFMAYRVDKAMKSFGFRIAYRFDELPTDREIANGDVEGYYLTYARNKPDTGKNQIVRFGLTGYSETTMEIQIAAIEDNALPNEEHKYNHFADKTIQSNNPDDFIKNLPSYLRELLEELDRAVEQINIVFDEIGPEIVNWARKYDLEGKIIPQAFELVFTSSHFESDIRVSFGPTSPNDFGYELIYLPKEGEPSFNFKGEPTQKIVGIDWTTNLDYIDELTNSLKEDLMEVVNNDLVV